VQTATVKQALKLFDVEYVDILPVEKGYRNEAYMVVLPSARKVTLYFYKADRFILPKIKAANFFSEQAARAGLPVRRLADPRLLKLEAPGYVRYACLYNWLPGKTIPWEAYTMNHLKLVGKALAYLHKRTQHSTYKTTNIESVCQQISDAAKSYYSDKGVQTALRKKLGLKFNKAAADQFFGNWPLNNPNRQLLHMDFVRGNLLFSNQLNNDDLTEGKVQLTGIIDFEKTVLGPISFDLARTLAFLLVDCKYKTPEQVRKYFLLAGYYKRGNGQAVKPAELDRLVSFFLLYDFYKFLKHNPYESLADNEHFIRTRDILLERKLLETV
jgi:Ser/Thr protein kinase RdoA (MazF antagonist)